MNDALRQLLSQAIDELAGLFTPLLAASSSPLYLFNALAQRGWSFDRIGGAEAAALHGAARDIFVACGTLRPMLSGTATSTEVLAAAGQSIAQALNRVRDLDLARTFSSAPEVHPDCVEALVRDLWEWLLLSALERRWPAVHELALMIGLVEVQQASALYAGGGRQPAAADDALLRYPVHRPVWNAGRLQSFVATPLSALDRVLAAVREQGATPSNPQQFLAALADALKYELALLAAAARRDAEERFYLQLDPAGVELQPPFAELADAGPVALPVPLPASLLEGLELSTVNGGRLRIAWKGLLPTDDSGDTVLLDVQGFALKLAGGGGGDGTALVLRSEDAVLALELRGRAALEIPLDILAGVDGGTLRAEGGASLSYVMDGAVRLALQSFVLTGTGVRLGGANGLVIEEARLEIGAVEFPLPPLSAARPLPFDLRLAGKLALPGANARIEVQAQYADGEWRLTSSGSVRFDNGVELLPAEGKPVLDLSAQPGAGMYRFAAAGALQFPQAAGAGPGRLMLSGALELQMVNRLPQVARFEMGASVANWQLSSDLTLRVLAVSLGYSADRFTAQLAAAIPFSGGFEIELLDAIPADLAAAAPLEPGLVVERSGSRLDFRVTGGIRLRVPVDVLTGGDGDEPVIAEAAGVFAFSTDPGVLPSLSNLSFALRASRLHLGGANGLIVEDAAVIATSVDRLLALGSAPHPTLSFSGRIVCPVDAPQGQVALALKGARFLFESAQRPPRFEFADGGELGFESAELNGLPLEITQGAVRFKDGARPLPQLLAPDNLVVSMGARLALDFAGSAGVMGEIDRVTVELRHGRPCLTLEGASAGVDGLSAGVMELSGALGLHNLHDPLNIQLEGTLGGTVYGAGVKALVAIRLENGVPTPLGACLDVNAGPSGIPIAYGFVIVGAAGGVSYVNGNDDPCSFRTYAQSRKPISSGRTLESRRPLGFDGCPCECPPPALNILCQPHPDQDAYPGRVILKFSSLDEAFWSPIPLPGGSTLGGQLRQLDDEIGSRLASATASFDPQFEAQRASDAVVDGAMAAIGQLIPALDPASVRPLPPPELRAQFDRLAGVLREPARYWAEQVRVRLAHDLAGALTRAKSGVTTERPRVYDIVKEQLYRGANCPDETLQVTGTFSYTGVSMFLSVTGGVNISTAGSIGVVGYLNVLSLPIGQLRAFVTVTSDVGDPEPSLCGDLRFEFGPLYLGQISLLYRCPGCVTNLAGTVAKFGGRLGGELLRRALGRIEQADHPFHARPGFDPAHPERVLPALRPAEASQLVAQVLSDLPALAPADAARALQFVGEMAGELWAGFNPEIRLCGKVAPKLFGLPLGGDLVAATGLVQKDHIEAQFSFSPMYLLGRVCPVADVFSGMDAARMGVAMSFPTVEQLIIDGLTGQYTSQARFEQYLNQGLARLLREAVFTFSYQFFPLGMKLADGQGRAVMPYLTPHPASASSAWKNPDTPAAGVPADKRAPARRTVLFAALDRGRLSDIHWLGSIKDVLDLPAAQQQLDLQRDYFPHGGLLGAGRLQVPRLLWDAPPLDLLGRVAGGAQWMERLRAFIELMRDWVLATREAGTLAFYIPAPNPPGPLRDAPGDNVRRVIDSLLDVDLEQLMPSGRVEAGDAYALHLAFFEGYVAGRLLGVDIGRADVYFVPPSSAGGASEMRLTADVSADARLRQWIKQGSLEIVVSNPPADRVLAPLARQPIEQRFMALLGRAQQALASAGPAVPSAPAGLGTTLGGLGGLGAGTAAGAVPPAAQAILLDVQRALSERLPKVRAAASVSLQIPPALAAFLGAQASASGELRAYSPWYESSATGTTLDALARRNGGLILRADLTFKLGTLWQFQAQAELSVQLPASLTQRARLAGRVEVGAVSGLAFLNAALPLAKAWLAFDSDPAAGQPLLALRGELGTLSVGPARLEPLSGTVLSIGLTAARAGNAAVVSMTLPAARVRLPGLASDTPVELRPAAGQSEITLPAAGGSATVVAPNGVKLLAPGGVVVLQVSGSATGTLAVASNGATTLVLSLPAGLQASVLPGDALLRREFNLAQAVTVTLRSDGTFTVGLTLPPLVLDGGLFTLHGAGSANDGIAVTATEQGINLAAPARLALRVPNAAAAQTAVLTALSLRTNGALAASGTQAVADLPGLVRASASAFSFERQGASFRLKLGNAQLTFASLPALAAVWNVELGTGFFAAQCTATGSVACGFGTRLSIDAAQWAIQASSFQSLALTAKSGSARLLGTPLSIGAGGAVALTLSANGTVSGEIPASGSVTLLPGLLELSVTRVAVSGGATAAVTVDGRMRALARPGGAGWLVDAAMSAALNGDQFETQAIAAGSALFASSEIALVADLGFGRDASGFYVALKPLRASYLGVALVNTSAKLRPGTPLAASWAAVAIPLPPFVLDAPSGSVSLDPSSGTLALSFAAGQLRTSSALWPAGKVPTPALQCQWSSGSVKPGSASVTLAGNDGGWQSDVPGVRYKLTTPAVRVRLALGAGSATSVVAGLTLTGATLQIETLAKRPDNGKPWASVDQALPDTSIGLDGRLALSLPALSPGTDPLKSLRASCESDARASITLPSVPAAPSNLAPQWVKDGYKAAVSAYNDAKAKLEKALNECGGKFPAPPASASIAGRTLTASVKQLFTLK